MSATKYLMQKVGEAEAKAAIAYKAKAGAEDRR
jgi:hypothetical protein